MAIRPAARGFTLQNTGTGAAEDQPAAKANGFGGLGSKAIGASPMPGTGRSLPRPAAGRPAAAPRAGAPRPSPVRNVPAARFAAPAIENPFIAIDKNLNATLDQRYAKSSAIPGVVAREPWRDNFNQLILVKDTVKVDAAGKTVMKSGKPVKGPQAPDLSGMKLLLKGYPPAQQDKILADAEAALNQLGAAGTRRRPTLNPVAAKQALKNPTGLPDNKGLTPEQVQALITLKVMWANQEDDKLFSESAKALYTVAAQPLSAAAVTPPALTVRAQILETLAKAVAVATKDYKSGAAVDAKIKAAVETFDAATDPFAAGLASADQGIRIKSAVERLVAYRKGIKASIDLPKEIAVRPDAPKADAPIPPVEPTPVDLPKTKTLEDRVTELALQIALLRGSITVEDTTKTDAASKAKITQAIANVRAEMVALAKKEKGDGNPFELLALLKEAIQALQEAKKANGIDAKIEGLAEKIIMLRGGYPAGTADDIKKAMRDAIVKAVVARLMASDGVAPKLAVYQQLKEDLKQLEDTKTAEQLKQQATAIGAVSKEMAKPKGVSLSLGVLSLDKDILLSALSIGAKLGTPIPDSNLKLGLKIKASASRDYSHGEGQIKDTQLFGPGPSGAPTGDTSLRASTAEVSIDNSNKTTGFQVAGAVGIARVSSFPLGDMELVLSEINSPFSADPFAGGKVFARTPLLGEKGNFQAGISAGGGKLFKGVELTNSALALGGYLSYFPEKPVDDTGNYKTDDKSQIAIAVRGVKQFDDIDSNAVSVDLGGIYHGKGSTCNQWSFGANLFLNPLLPKTPEETDVSSYSGSAKATCTTGSNTFGLNAGYANKSISRELLTATPGTPSVGAPEISQVVTPMFEVGALWMRSFGSIDAKASLSLIGVSEGTGVMTQLGVEF